jgi:hypothetical protein
MPENDEALELWLAVRTQWRAAGFGLVGLDYPAVERMAERLEIELSFCMLRKIQALERYSLDDNGKPDEEEKKDVHPKSRNQRHPQDRRGAQRRK